MTGTQYELDNRTWDRIKDLFKVKLGESPKSTLPTLQLLKENDLCDLKVVMVECVGYRGEQEERLTNKEYFFKINGIITSLENELAKKNIEAYTLYLAPKDDTAYQEWIDAMREWSKKNKESALNRAYNNHQISDLRLLEKTEEFKTASKLFDDFVNGRIFPTPEANEAVRQKFNGYLEQDIKARLAAHPQEHPENIREHIIRETKIVLSLEKEKLDQSGNQKNVTALLCTGKVFQIIPYLLTKLAHLKYGQKNDASVILTTPKFKQVSPSGRKKSEQVAIMPSTSTPQEDQIQPSSPPLHLSPSSSNPGLPDFKGLFESVVEHIVRYVAPTEGPTYLAKFVVEFGYQIQIQTNFQIHENSQSNLQKTESPSGKQLLPAKSAPAPSTPPMFVPQAQQKNNQHIPQNTNPLSTSPESKKSSLAENVHNTLFGQSSGRSRTPDKRIPTSTSWDEIKKKNEYEHRMVK